MAESFTPSQGTELERVLVVKNEMGIHARPAAMMVRLANKFEAEIFVEKDGEQVDGKSIMGLMMLAAGEGTQLRVTAIGSDAATFLEDLHRLFENRFEDG